MILEVTYEGNGIFKVFPPPIGTDIKRIIERIDAESKEDELQEEIEGLETRIGELEDEKRELEEIIDKVKEAIQ